MKAEYVNIPGKGLCILISGFANIDEIAPSIQKINMFSDLNIIADCIRANRKIQAIKEVRSQSGWGLKEAKYYMDNYMPMSPNEMTHTDEFYARESERFITDHQPKIDFLQSDEFEL